MLIQLKDGRKILTADHYLLSKHEELFGWVQAQYGEVQQILWSGELELLPVNDGSPKILRANETSSFAKKMKDKNDPRAPGATPVRALEEFLNQHTGSRTAQSEFIAFDKKNERIDFEFQTLQLADVRHDLGTLVTHVYGGIFLAELEFHQNPKNLGFLDFVKTQKSFEDYDQIVRQLLLTMRYLETRLNKDFGHANLVENLEKLSLMRSDIQKQNAVVQNLLLKFSSDLSNLINAHQASKSPQVLWISPR